MKIYRVVYTETGETRGLWLSYRSAVTSGAQTRAETAVEVANIPDSAWKPANSVAEQRLRRVEDLWNMLSHTDAESLDELLQQLLARQKRMATVTPAKPLLREEERTEAMLRLNRLVDAG